MFLSYLKSSSVSLDILCLQEVSAFHQQDHLTAEQCQYFQSYLFSGYAVIFTKYSAIICLNKNLHLDNAIISLDERCISANIKDTTKNDIICTVLNIYGPANSSDRLPFLQSFTSSPFVQLVEEDKPMFLLGDLNLQLQKLVESSEDPRFTQWYEWLTSSFSNCFMEGNPTFQRGTTTATIDYIFCKIPDMTRVINNQQLLLPTSWTDHQLLYVDFMCNREDIGPGSWRFNASLLQNESFINLLDDVIDLFLSRIESSGKSTQDLWESFKRALKDTAESFSTGFKKRRYSHMQKLQQKFQSLNALPLSNEELQIQRASISQQLSEFIENEVKTEMQQMIVRSATRWHELGERNTNYFYKVIKMRQSKQTIQALRSSTTGELVESTSDILNEAHHFYNNLYTPEAIDLEAVNSLLRNIPADIKLSESQATEVGSEPSDFELQYVVNHCPSQRSPGLDGLPFELYKYMFTKFPDARKFFLKVLVDALQGIIPTSWQQTRMVLLYKKGDPALLSNWRPLSLINTDAKIFTKILANRFNVVLPKLINPYQTGFLPHRLISDNGWVNTTLMNNYRTTRDPRASSAVAVMLDQEKAYDRVHPEYLAAVLDHFGFPKNLIDSLNSLFFGTAISVSINGFLGAPFTQARGLRQGDPLSPLLFNLAFEPLLRTILASSLSGVSLLPVRTKYYSTADSPKYHHPLTGIDDSAINRESPAIFKLLSYADDLEVFLSSPDEWPILQELLIMYSAASNAKVNINKTDIVSISGINNQAWQAIANTEDIDYHTKESSNAVRYLGYPLYSSTHQLRSYLNRITTVIKNHCKRLKDRGLSVRGLSLIANSQVLSKIWHLIRVVPVPKKWLTEIRQVVKKFVLPFRPSPSWNSICQKKNHGGLGVIDVLQQHLGLQLIFIQRLLKSKRESDFVTPLIGQCILLYTGQHSYLPWIQYPRQYLPLFKRLPTLSILTRLLMEIPVLIGHTDWNGRWYADIPLRCALFSITPKSSPEYFDVSEIPLRYTVADLIPWSYFYNSFTNFLRVNNPPPSGRLNEILELLKKGISIQWSSRIKKYMPEDFNQDIPPSQYRTSDRMALVPTTEGITDCRVPLSYHWQIRFNKNKTVRFYKMNPGLLRRYWSQKQYLCVKYNGPLASQGIIKIPYQVPPGYCHPKVWKLFWSLKLPHKVVTCWWRLLKESLSTQCALHNLNSRIWPTTTCRICNSYDETLFHFSVGCSHKWVYWQAALQELSLSRLVINPTTLWYLLTSLHLPDEGIVDEYTLELVGHILETLWKYHWHCVTTKVNWSTASALARLRSSLTLEFTIKNHQDNDTVNSQE